MEKESSLTFGELLKSFRKRSRVNQTKLAEQIGTTRQTIGNWERGDNLPKSRAMLLEVAKVLRLSDSETRQLLEASITSITIHWLVPHPRNLLFTGRAESLATLHQWLSTEQTVVLTQSYAVHGLGGVGKTQLALEYAYRHKLEYSAIFWMHAETLEQITSSFVAIADYLELSERKETDQQHIIAAVQRWLNKQRGWLLIWDNLEDFEVFSRFLSATPFGAHLITTRSPVHGTLAQGLELLALPAEHALLFLLCRAKLLDIHATPKELALWARRNPTEYQAAKEMTDLLGCLPLALDQAGAYIEETHCGLAGYLNRYQKQRKTLLARRGSPDTGHPESVATTFALASQHLANSASDLLKVIAFLGAENIPEELFMKPLPELDSALKEVLGNPVELDLTLAALLRSSLIQRQPETQCFSLHRLVQAVQQEELGEEGQHHWAEVAVRLVAAAFPDSRDFANWELCQRLLPHAVECASHIRRWGLTLLEGARLLNEVGLYLRQRSQLSEALPLLEQALAIREQVVGPLHLEVADSLNALGGYYWMRGENEKAASLFKQALSIRESNLEPNDLRVIQTLNNLGYAYKDMGRLEEAQPLLQNAVVLFEQILGHDHPHVAVSLNNLGDIAFNLKQHDQAEPMYRRALEIREQALGPEHPDVAISLTSLAGIYSAQERYELAEELLQRALLIREKALGPNHADVALSLHDLANALAHLGKHVQAVPLYERAVAIHKGQSLETGRTIAFLTDLAAVCWWLEDHQKAHELFQRSLAMAERIFGSETPYTAEIQTRYTQLIQRWQQFKEVRGGVSAARKRST